MGMSSKPAFTQPGYGPWRQHDPSQGMPKFLKPNTRIAFTMRGDGAQTWPDHEAAGLEWDEYQEATIEWYAIHKDDAIDLVLDPARPEAPMDLQALEARHPQWGSWA